METTKQITLNTNNSQISEMEVYEVGKSYYSNLSQTSFSVYLHNQWTYFHKLSCAVKPQIRAIYIYVEYTEATTNN